MRIVAGRFRGASLIAPKNNDVRPTSDRVREAVFNILAHGEEPLELEGMRALDLFAGTGALGLEAISRGAAYALFVEEAVGARALIRRNVEALGATGVTRIYRRDATKLGEVGTLRPFDILFADPPYGKGLAEQAVASAADGGWLVPNAFAIVEERSDAGFAPPEGFIQNDVRVYGDTSIYFLRYTVANGT
jgi:16S rRNA (guanine966-N2)-methyltransferase